MKHPINASNDECFSREELKNYALGRTNDLVAVKIESHLGDCASCEDTFVALEAAEDTFVRDLKNINEIEVDSDDAQNVDLSSVKHLVDESSNLSINGHRSLETNGKTLIGDYQILESLGQGGMGQVFRATHRHLDKEFALKILGVRKWTSVEAISRFQREMKIVGQLDHPTIVQATDAGQEGDLHYLTMEFVPGLNLAKVLHYAAPIQVADACEMVRQAAEGIDYAHQQDVIHRDIKPSNLMLNEKGRVKILDLGLATLCGNHHAVDELTTVGQMMGTLDYMAPEQCDAANHDHRCDIYSLGATLYKLLTGRAPYSTSEHESPIQKLRAIAVEEFTPIQNHRTDLAPALVEIIHRCLERDPQQRFDSAADLAKALENHCRGCDLQKVLVVARQAKPETTEQPELELFAAANETQAQPKSTLPEKSQPVPPRRTAWRGWVAFAIALAMIPAAWMGIQIVINWEKGQLVIESDSDNVQVRLVKDGKPYKELNIQQGANSTKVRAGKYEIIIDDPSDQLVVDKETFKLLRGDTTVAKITSRPKSKPNDVAGSSTPKDSGQPTYKNRTMAEWLENASAPETFTAAQLFRRTAPKKDRRAAVMSLLKDKQNELSMDDLYFSLKVAGELCPDEETANAIFDFILKVVARYEFQEIIEGKIRVYRSGTMTSLLGAARHHEALFRNRINQCLVSKQPTDVAFALAWVSRTRDDVRNDKQFLTNLIKLTESENPVIAQYADWALLRNYPEQDSALKVFQKRVTQKGIEKMPYFDALISRKPDSTVLGEAIVAELKDCIDGRFSQLTSHVGYLAAIQKNPAVLEKLHELYADKNWGWEIRLNNSRSRNRVSSMMGGGAISSGGGGMSSMMGNAMSRNGLYSKDPEFKSVESWKGQHDPEKYDPKDVYSRVTNCRRNLLLNEIHNVQGKNIPSDHLMPLLKSQLDLHFNNVYLGVVLGTIQYINNKEANAYSKFWVDSWLKADLDSDARKRALAVLKASLEQRPPSHLPWRTDDDEIFNAFTKIDCVNPDRTEKVAIQEAAAMVLSQTTRSSLYDRVGKELTKSEAAFLLWVIRFAAEDSKHRGTISRTDVVDRLIKQVAKSNDPLLVLRSLSLRKGYRDFRLGTGSGKVDPSILGSGKNKNLRMAFFQSIRKSREQFDKEFFEHHYERTSADELAGLLDYCKTTQRPVPTKHPGMRIDYSATPDRNKIDWLIQLLAKPREELMQTGVIYDVDFWNEPMLKKSEIPAKPNVFRLLEALRRYRFIEKDFGDKKTEIVATLKKALEMAKDDRQKQLAQLILDKVERSQSVAAYVRAAVIEAGAKNFREVAGVFPDRIEDLLILPKGMDNQNWKGPHVRNLVSPKDPWGTEFKFVKSEIKNRIEIISAGPDKEFGTDDDVSSRDSRLRELAE